jgi:hypothetical protein
MSQKRRFSLEQSYSFVALRDREREREMANLEMCRRKRALLKDPIGKAKVKRSWSMF